MRSELFYLYGEVNSLMMGEVLLIFTNIKRTGTHLIKLL